MMGRRKSRAPHAEPVLWRDLDNTALRGSDKRRGALPHGQLALGLLVLVVGGAFVSNHAGLLRDLVPALLPLCALLLLRRNPASYHGLLLGSLFFVPMLRRLVDSSAGFYDPNPILLAPYLVALVGPLLGWRVLLSAPLRQLAPFLACLVAIALGGLVGLGRYPITSLAHSGLQWATPVLFAAWLTVGGEQQSFRDGLRRFLPPLLVLAALYTVLQFALAFPWDMAWLLNLDLPSMGGTEPFTIRAFGPVNSAGTAAFVFASGGLYLLHSSWRWRMPALALTTAALLTTQVRAGWLAFAIGLLLSFAFSPRRTAGAMAMLLALGGVLSVAGLGSGEVNIADRLQSFGQGSDDTSANSRVDGYGAALYYVTANPLGAGLGVAEDFFDIEGDFSLQDSAPVSIFVTFGLLGGALYCIGLLSLLVPAARALTHGREPGRIALPALALLSVALLGNVCVDLPGLLVWSLLAASVASPAPAFLARQRDLLGVPA